MCLSSIYCFILFLHTHILYVVKHMRMEVKYFRRLLRETNNILDILEPYFIHSYV